ncbi:KEOPS complex subunit Pcc1 [Methanothermobacter sp. EMTCatA1]|jgi:tRNA threonylcarbamoyladenosine modification (KEOPS) complex  Pcc1 subunit|uniref:KEOPS complex subunit Pcc1 n=1 Tax=Methanothermobacter sp. EMTCatA1 TaxID=2017966 RepID=UPI000B5F17F4|nr:KEOPS complex subunit Pcc1 [Methanothermobacter sp. EMTCatA1]MBC7111152.1 hypothetical protein [Methanothermobacter sp.]HIH71284.1 hypothetical protein [Methanothermobacter thermautotrophicus]MDK2875331.1 hypothetical protein [Methanothermobacter sp.]MDN5374373.1 hypothetical protein [Methanothermobacter sp.]BAZ99135.1 hypothetical protein tca_01076 [Methanothermobacter sp. EMTCatA1]
MNPELQPQNRQKKRMMISITIKAEYESREEAEIIKRALEPDNASFVESEIQGSEVRFTTEADSIGTALNTADDLIFSEMVVEKMMKPADTTELL